MNFIMKIVINVHHLKLKSPLSFFQGEGPGHSRQARKLTNPQLASSIKRLHLISFITLSFLYLSFFLEKKRNKKFKKRSSTAARAGHTPATFSGLHTSQISPCTQTFIVVS
jgi:hypothetical protein